MGRQFGFRYTTLRNCEMNGMIWLRASITRFLNVEFDRPGQPTSDLERLQRTVRPGDVILLEGRSRVSDVIRWVTQSPWTHAALVVGRISEVKVPAIKAMLRQHYPGSEHEPLLVESYLGLGTILRPLSHYEGCHLRLARPNGLKPADADRVVAYAVSQIGVAYDVRQIFDLLRFLFPWFIVPKRWRSSLFARRSGNDTKTVCSTMIAEAFGQVQFPILPLVVRKEDGSTRYYRKNPKLCTPRDFDYSPYFDILKHPRLDQGGYDAIAWHRMSELDPQQQGIYVDLEYKPSILDLPQDDIAQNPTPSMEPKPKA